MQAFEQADLDSFYALLSPNIPSGTAPTIDLIDGATIQTTSTGFGYNAESDLDLEYAISLGKANPFLYNRQYLIIRFQYTPKQ